MKNRIFIILFLVNINTIKAQPQYAEDSLKAIISQQKGDTTEVNTLVYLANQQAQIDLRIKYAQQGVLLAKKISYSKGQADGLWVLGALNARAQGNFSQGIKYFLDALTIYQELRDIVGIASTHLALQANYRIIENYTESLDHAFKGEHMAEVNNVKGKMDFPGHRLAPLFLAEIGGTYLRMNQLDSALYYTQKSINQKELFNEAEWNFPVYLLATIQYKQGNYKGSLESYRRAVPLAIKNHFFSDTLQIFSGMSTLFKKTGELDSAIYYAQMVIRSLNPELQQHNLIEAVNNLAQAYKLRGDKDSALKYMELSHNFEDSIFSKEKDRQVQKITFNEQLKQQEILSAQAKYKNKVQLYILVSGLFFLLLIAGILWRNNRHRKKVYALLERQKQETDLQKMKVEHAFEELKSAQSQLVQREKMASLGELTAGIAHEIQNPLNFVNNFSEVNKELVEELQQELKAGKIDDAIEISNDIKSNEEKINHHGKRADAIVKGMLQHSRSSSGTNEPTDINALCDEYLRLSYHGLRAKDKSFNATMKTDFDETIGNINIVPQDVGRVVLNLINNAFYVVDEKKKSPHPLKGGEEYEPIVTVSTKRLGSPLGDGGKPDSYRVEIRVADNGNGIPQKVLDKIFQPFFTTKPTGKGTGLGLSLSYDIVKAHGGEIKVITKENEGSEFIISLPV